MNTRVGVSHLGDKSLHSIVEHQSQHLNPVEMLRCDLMSEVRARDPKNVLEIKVSLVCWVCQIL